MDNYCKKTKEATNELLGKWIIKCEAFQDKLKAVAAINAAQEQFSEVLKQELADLKLYATKKDGSIGETD